jgi:bifunctional non-homologous end joining protein LigD
MIDGTLRRRSTAVPNVVLCRWVRSDGEPLVTSVSVSVDGRVLKLSNLDKVLYPQVGFTKGEVIDYYVAVAPVLLPRLAGRPLTLRRYPEGADTDGFFEKHASRHAPAWVRTVLLATRKPQAHPSGPAETEYVLLDDLPGLVWAANLAALELHVPQWTMSPDGGRGHPDLMVFDLDPGPPADIVTCCRVAELLVDALAADGLPAWAKTSGSKGMQLYVPVTVDEVTDTSEYARQLCLRLAASHPDLVVGTMAKQARPGRVYIDWSQNHQAKTTIAAYSLRARREPTVSTPLTWAEVRACQRPDELVFTAADVRARLDAHGDLLADLEITHYPLPVRR